MEKKKAIQKHYRYYEATDDELKVIAAKELGKEDITYPEVCLIIQRLFPNNMIASGLFDAFLIFDVKDDGVRIDPPKDYYHLLDMPSQNGNNPDDKVILLEKMINHLEDLKIVPHPSWYEVLTKIKGEPGHGQQTSNLNS